MQPRTILLALLCLFVVGGCGDSSTSNPVSGSQSTVGGPVPQGGIVSGRVFRNPATPRSVGSLVFLTADQAPDGFAPLGSVSVVVSNGEETETSTTEPDGSFRIGGLPGGSYLLTVGGVTLPITLLFDTELSLASPPVTREQAATLARAAIQSRGVRLETTLGLGPQSALPEGVRVVPGMSEGLGEPTELSAPITVSKRSWFFYFDPRPDTRFSHPGFYVFVDAVTGESQVLERANFPELNGTEFYASKDANLRHPDLIQTPTEIPSAVLARVAAPSSVNAQVGSQGVLAQEASPCGDGEVYALLIRASTEPDFERDVQNMERLLRETTNANVTVLRMGEAGPNQSQLDKQPRAVISAAVRSVFSQMSPCDTFVFYVTAHSLRQSPQSSSRSAFVSSIFKTMKYKNFFGTNKTKTIEKRGVITQWQGLGLEECPSCDIVMILDICFSGDMIKDSPEFQNPISRAGQNLFSVMSSLRGRRILFLAGAGEDSFSKSYEPGFATAFSSAEPGGFYTNTLIEKFRANPREDLIDRFSGAHGFVLAERLAQGPVSVSVRPTEEERRACQQGVTITPTPTPSPTVPTDPVEVTVDTDPGTAGEQLLVTFQHELGTTPCPQSLGTLVVSNPSTTDVIEVRFNPDSFLQVAPFGPVQIQPGQSRNFQVNYDCTATASFSSDLQVLVSAPGSLSTIKTVTYQGTLTSATCVTRAVFRNEGPGPVFASFRASNTFFSREVLVPQGGEFVETRDQELQGLNIAFGSFPRNFSKTVTCGKQGVFIRNGPNVTYVPEDIP